MANKKIPMRRCVGCKESKPKKELIRIVESGDVFSLDATGKKNGRGAYLCRDPQCLRSARKSKGLERSFGHAIPAEIYEDLEKELSALGE